MTGYCVVPNCPGRDKWDIRLFKFPEAYMREWCQNLHLNAHDHKWDWRVCSRHFDPDCIGKLYLRQGSMPTEYLGHDGDVIQSNLTRNIPVRIRKCLVKNCKVTGPLNTMHSVPERKRKDWLDRCGVPDTNPKRDFRICSKHFEPSMIGKRCLRKHAVPTLHLGETIRSDEQQEEVHSPIEIEHIIIEEEEIIDCKNCEKFTSATRFYEKRCADLQHKIGCLEKDRDKSIQELKKLKEIMRRMTKKEKL